MVSEHFDPRQQMVWSDSVGWYTPSRIPNPFRSLAPDRPYSSSASARRPWPFRSIASSSGSGANREARPVRPSSLSGYGGAPVDRPYSFSGYGGAPADRPYSFSGYGGAPEDRPYFLSGYGGGPNRSVVKVPGSTPGKIPNPSSDLGKMKKSVVRYEAEASDPTAVWRVVHLRPSEEPRKLPDRVPPAEWENEKTRRSGDLRWISLNSTQGTRLRNTSEGNFNSPPTGFSVVANGRGEDQLPHDFVASPTLNNLNPSHGPELARQCFQYPRKLAEMVHSGDLEIPEIKDYQFEDGTVVSKSEGVEFTIKEDLDCAVLEDFGIPSWLFELSLPTPDPIQEPTLVKQWPQSPKEYLSQPHSKYQPRQWNPNFSNERVHNFCKPLEPLDWNQQSETNLAVVNNLDEAKFDLAQLYEGERADKRLRCIGLFWKLPPWPDFCTMNCNRFAQHSEYEVIEKFYSVEQYSHSVLDCIDKIEEVVLNTFNKQVRHFIGSGNTPMVFPLKPVIEEIQKSAEESGDRRIAKMCFGLLKARKSHPEYNYVAYRKGIGAVCNKKGGAHFHEAGCSPYNLQAQMLPKSHHCYFIRLMLEYFKFSSLDADESSACKYVILSKKARMESLSQFGHLHFLFPEIFKDLNKGVMLGDGVIVQRDLSFLGNLNMGDKVNSTAEFWGVRLDQVRNLLGEITYDSKSCAWMSGVNVTNLDKWRKHDVTEDYLLLLKKFKTKDIELFKENVALCSNANAKKGTTGGNDNQNQTDLFNWEDATKISAEKSREYGCKHSNTGAEVSKDKYGYYQKKKYRRDFLVKFKQKLHANLSKCVFAASHVEYLGLEMNWDANPSIILDIKIRLGVSLPIQVKDIGFTGVLHLIFRPRVNELPCFGAVCFSLRQKKRLDFTLWVIGGEISVIPGISDGLEDTIKNAIEDSITWPVRKVIPIISGDYSDLELKSVGTVEVNLVQARDLTNNDVIGKSDPFAILYVRPFTDKTKRSKTINNDLNPIWNEHFEFIVEDADTQSTTVKIYDDDGIQELKLQLEVFFSCVVLRLAQSKYGANFQQQEVALEILVNFYRRNEFMAEIFHFLQCSNVFGDIANLISKSAFPVNSPLSALNVLALDGLVVVVQAIAERTDNAPKHHEQASPEISEYFPFWQLKCENSDDPDQWVRYVHQQKGIKRKLMVGVEHFNRDKKKGFEYLQGVHLLSEKLDPHNIALFYRYIPGLGKIFLGTTLVIRKIQRILEAFSERCYEQSPHMFVNKGVALVLSYSVIMLNTDQKNVRVKKEMDKNLFTVVKIQWFNGSICYLKKLLGGMQILSKEHSLSSMPRQLDLDFLIFILEDKYVVEGKVLSEPAYLAELKKERSLKRITFHCVLLVSSDGLDADLRRSGNLNAQITFSNS